MKSTPRHNALGILEEALARKFAETRKRAIRYSVPSLWGSVSSAPRAVRVQPYQYYLSHVRKALRARPPRPGKPSGGEWTRDAVIYNMFVRTTTAFDHNGNGKLDLPVNGEGFRETGTFLKAIVLLPYIKRLGANTVHLLPTTSIGHDGNKGTLGSPYAIRNPYELDENLSEPSLGLDAKTEFRAFVEAAHRYGLRVVVEFVFRTAAKDGDWVKEHPEWFYWIRDDVETRHPAETEESKYGSPLFTREELERIHVDVREKHFGNLIPPHPVYRAFFTEPPAGENVNKEGPRYVGVLADGRRVKIPGAFADWPPDDNQPPWGDVTYLRMYTHPDFNYIGYNTIRMYDTRLMERRYINRPLWDRIVGIVPYYQREYAIDGVMIDMGHALPMELKSEMIATARRNNPDFAFWDENFSVTQQSRDEGYNAVFGYLWTDEHHPDRMRRLFRKLSTERFPIPFFATPENHNTPRAAARPAGVPYARWSLVVNSFLPAIPFIHSGYELAERYPINTGLDFTSEQIRQLPSERLPLFSEYGYNWLSREQFTFAIAKVLQLRAKYHDMIVNDAPGHFHVLETDQEKILAFARSSTRPAKRIAIVGNPGSEPDVRCAVVLETRKKQVKDLLSGRKFTVKDGRLAAELKAGECIVFEY